MEWLQQYDIQQRIHIIRAAKAVSCNPVDRRELDSAVSSHRDAVTTQLTRGNFDGRREWTHELHRKPRVVFLSMRTCEHYFHHFSFHGFIKVWQIPKSRTVRSDEFLHETVMSGCRMRVAPRTRPSAAEWGRFFWCFSRSWESRVSPPGQVCVSHCCSGGSDLEGATSSPSPC